MGIHPLQNRYSVPGIFPKRIENTLYGRRLQQENSAKSNGYKSQTKKIQL
jgi:hypothetical protein